MALAQPVSRQVGRGSAARGLVAALFAASFAVFTPKRRRTAGNRRVQRGTMQEAAIPPWRLGTRRWPSGIRSWKFTAAGKSWREPRRWRSCAPLKTRSALRMQWRTYWPGAGSARASGSGCLPAGGWSSGQCPRRRHPAGLRSAGLPLGCLAQFPAAACSGWLPAGRGVRVPWMLARPARTPMTLWKPGPRRSLVPKVGLEPTRF